MAPIPFAGWPDPATTALLLGLPPVLVPVRWPRSPGALIRARHAADRHGHRFARVEVRA